MSLVAPFRSGNTLSSSQQTDALQPMSDVDSDESVPSQQNSTTPGTSSLSLSHSEGAAGSSMSNGANGDSRLTLEERQAARNLIHNARDVRQTQVPRGITAGSTSSHSYKTSTRTDSFISRNGRENDPAIIKYLGQVRNFFSSRFASASDDQILQITKLSLEWLEQKLSAPNEDKIRTLDAALALAKIDTHLAPELSKVWVECCFSADQIKQFANQHDLVKNALNSLLMKIQEILETPRIDFRKASSALETIRAVVSDLAKNNDAELYAKILLSFQFVRWGSQNLGKKISTANSEIFKKDLEKLYPQIHMLEPNTLCALKNKMVEMGFDSKIAIMLVISWRQLILPYGEDVANFDDFTQQSIAYLEPLFQSPRQMLYSYLNELLEADESTFVAELIVKGNNNPFHVISLVLTARYDALFYADIANGDETFLQAHAAPYQERFKEKNLTTDCAKFLLETVYEAMSKFFPDFKNYDERKKLTLAMHYINLKY